MKTPNNNLTRVFFDFLVFSAAVFSPWWLTFSLALAGALFFKNYYELFFIGLWIDAVLWNGVFHSIPFFFSLLGIILFLTLGKIRTYIKV